MDSKLNNILGEYLRFLTGGFMKGGASPKFDEEIHDAKNIDDLLPVVKYYFCYEDPNPAIGIRDVELTDLYNRDIIDNLSIRPDSREINTEYIQNQIKIVDKLVDKKNIVQKDLSQLYRITRNFANMIRYEPGKPPAFLLPPYPPNVEINRPAGPDAPPNAKKTLTDEIVEYIMGLSVSIPVINSNNFTEIQIEKIEAIPYNPTYLFQYQIIRDRLQEIDDEIDVTSTKKFHIGTFKDIINLDLEERYGS
jgi:hypothetical protein